MARMRNLIAESKYLKREFGESLPTFKDVMEKHQVNKLKEDWWSNMSAKQQAAYIKAHPKSQQAQDATDDTAGDPDDSWDDEEGRAKPTGKTDADIDDYDMGEVPGSRGTGPWTPEDDPDFEHGPTLTSAPGRVPDEEDEESSGRTGTELNQETLTIDGKQFRRITEGKIDTRFIKYRIYDKIADEINKVEPDDFNLRDFNPLKRKLIQFVQREVKRDKKMGTMSVLKQAWERSDFDDKVFGRRGIIDGWYKKSERDFPKFMKKYTTYSDNPKKGWKNYNASSLTYGIGKSLYKIVDSLLDGINSLVPESVHAFAEFYQRFKRQEK